MHDDDLEERAHHQPLVLARVLAWVLAGALSGCSDAEECTYAGGGNEYCTELYVCCTRSGCSVISDDIEIPCDAGDCDQAFAAGALWACEHGTAQK